MDIPLPTRDLNQKSLADARALFASLPPPERSQLSGVYQAAFVGPAWVAEILGTGLITAAHLESAAIPADTRRVLFKTDNTRAYFFDVLSIKGFKSISA